MDEIIETTPIKPAFYDYYLKFTDEATANSVLASSGVVVQTEAVLDEEGNIAVPAGIVPIEGCAVDVVGTISKVDNTDPENPKVTSIEGWHINVRSLEEKSSLAKYDTKPVTPMRVWA